MPVEAVIENPLRIPLLSLYDYGARFYDPQIGRWHVVDPMIEAHQNYTPYAYVYNNPLLLIDPFGLDSTYYNEKGEKIYTCGQNSQSNKDYVIKTTKTTDEIYVGVTDENPQKGFSNPISKSEAKNTEKQIVNANIEGEHMNNLVEIPNLKAREGMLSITDADNGKGGSFSGNNQERGGNFTPYGTVMETNPGPVNNLRELANKSMTATIPGNPQFHGHNSGTFSFEGGILRYIQGPSFHDIQTAGSRQEYVLSYGSSSYGGKTVYIYNATGVVATMPLKKWK